MACPQSRWQSAGLGGGEKLETWISHLVPSYSVLSPQRMFPSGVVKLERLWSGCRPVALVLGGAALAPLPTVVTVARRTVVGVPARAFVDGGVRPVRPVEGVAAASVAVGPTAPGG